MVLSGTYLNVVWTVHDPEPASLIEEDAEMWWPWPSREACLLDITGAFPRALFSESEMAASRWLASRLGAKKLPTIRQVKLARDAVQRVTGLAPKTVQSQLGNLYTVEDIERIIRHVSLLCLGTRMRSDD